MRKYNLFDISSLSPRARMYEGVELFFAWVIPSFVYVVFVRWLSTKAEREYLNFAISEAIGPHLWNVMGVFGFVLFGLVLIFPMGKKLAQFTSHALLSVFAVGCLMIGVILGEIVMSSNGDAIEVWRLWLAGVGIGVVLVAIILLNAALWYMGSLVYGESHPTAFIIEVSKQPMVYRLIAAPVIALVPVILLWFEK